MNDIRNAPPSLSDLFRSERSLEDKALKFLELHWECGGKIRRTARRLRETQPDCRIHHTTVKNLIDFLQDTEVYYKFQSFLSDQVEDFFSGAIFTGLYEQYQNDLKIAREMIKRYIGKTPGEKAEKTRPDHDMALKWIRFEKSILDKLANISLTVKGYGHQKDSEDEDRPHDKKYLDVYKEAEEFDESTVDVRN